MHLDDLTDYLGWLGREVEEMRGWKMEEGGEGGNEPTEFQSWKGLQRSAILG